jgi:hypothetical protein
VPVVGILSGILNIFLHYIYHSAVLLIFIHIRTIFPIERLRFPRCQINWRIRGVGTRKAGLSHRTSFGKITSEGHRPGASGRTSESADRRRTAQADGPLADGPCERPVLRQSAQPPYRKTARNIITFFNFFSPLQGSPSSTVAPRVTPQSYFLL